VRFLLFAGILAIVVLVALFTALRPLARHVIVGWAWDTPSSFRLPFVADLIREDLGAALTAPAGTDATDQVFAVETGDTPELVAPRLKAQGLIADVHAFEFAAFETGLAGKMKAGNYLVRPSMTPVEVARALVDNPVLVTTVKFVVKEGVRLEQIVGKLQTIQSKVDPKAFDDLATHPPASLVADYPFLAGLPQGASLEGFLYPATYTLVTSSNGAAFKVTDAETLIRMMLDKFASTVGNQRMAVPDTRGLTFYQVLTLASIVEREAVLDSERSLIAGVYQNRLVGYKGVAKLLNADPTVIYAFDSLQLAKIPLDTWQSYFFWKVPPTKMADITLPTALASYQTYKVAGLPAGPICSPSVASIDAALQPDTQDGYLYFVAIPNGGGAHAFAKTLAEHNANLKKYGYL
jgi:UPF0755 protein